MLFIHFKVLFVEPVVSTASVKEVSQPFCINGLPSTRCTTADDQVQEQKPPLVQGEEETSSVEDEEEFFTGQERRKSLQDQVQKDGKSLRHEATEVSHA
ncbi:unnamed protein product [Strongylus vulgaris]|uniref:Uncharacterized protein n=1 Tax=Strongylus vulgaris TaxID=40348 RepID=A0A3P7K3S8_STRVU|nr:unnamed protein product [Strongylus vulgaris]